MVMNISRTIWYNQYFDLVFLVFRKKDQNMIIHAKAPIHEIQQISYGFQVKSGRFRMDFIQISGENPPDFTHEIRWISYGFQV